jgi:hypothetical protein
VTGDATEDGFRIYPDDFEREPLGTNPFAVEHNPNTHSSMVTELVDLWDQANESSVPALRANGFEFISMAQDPIFTAALRALAKANKLSTETMALIRQRLEGRRLSFSGESSLLILHVAKSGLMMRAVGPNQTATHGHSWNPIAHSDQNVQGLPLTHLMAGLAPFLFNWQYSPVLLLNLWVPIQPIKCQPLVLMDKTSVAQENRLHYHIYARDEILGERLNDCWTFTHNASQHWWWQSNLGDPNNTPAAPRATPAVTHGVLFSTLHTPHTSTTLPGEELIQPLWHVLRQIGQKALAEDIDSGQAIQAAEADDAAHTVVMNRSQPELKCTDIGELLRLSQQAADNVRAGLLSVSVAGRKVDIDIPQPLSAPLADSSPDLTEIPQPVREMVIEMLGMHEKLKSVCSVATSEGTSEVLRGHMLEAHAITERAIRKSLEMRLVAIQLPSPAAAVQVLLLGVAFAASFYVHVLSGRQFREMEKPPPAGERTA